MFRLATRRAYTASARVFNAEAAASGELMVNFSTPYAPIVPKQAVEMITLPGESGVYAITKDHAPTVSQLQPGVVSIAHIGVSILYTLIFLFILLDLIFYRPALFVIYCFTGQC